MDVNTWSLPSRPRTIDKFDRYAALRDGWQFSIRFLNDLQKACSARLSDNVETVAIAGSFGRLEGSAQSDADYIIVVRDTGASSTEADRAILQEETAKLGVSPPNKSGVFSEPRTREELIENAGAACETFDELGKRMLLLLESRPIFHESAFEKLLSDIFNKYADFVLGDGDKEFAYLLNDLIRYFRYICVNYQSNFWRQNEKWAIRNLKLRHSRIVMYAGLLFLLGESSKERGNKKVQLVREGLVLTPVERLAWVYERNKDSSFFRILGLYNVFVSRAADEAWRKQLNIEYHDRYKCPEFSEMKANSDGLIAELLRFLLARRGQWSERFFEYLFF